MTQLDYVPAPGLFDELFEGPGVPRAPASALTDVLGRLGPDRLRSAAERRDAIFVQQGITFDASGPDGGPAVTARPNGPRAAHPAGRRVGLIIASRAPRITLADWPG